MSMELYIETLTGTEMKLRVSPYETILNVKARIQKLEGKCAHKTGRSTDKHIYLYFLFCCMYAKIRISNKAV